MKLTKTIFIIYSICIGMLFSQNDTTLNTKTTKSSVTTSSLTSTTGQTKVTTKNPTTITSSITTGSVMTSTTTSKPDDNVIKVNKTCFIAEMKLTVIYGINMTTTFPSISNKSVNCNNDSYIPVKITYQKTHGKIDLLMIFKNDSKNFLLSESSINIQNGTKNISADESGLNLFKTELKKSFKCNATQSIKFKAHSENVTLEFTNLKVQAFHRETVDYGAETECEADKKGKTSNIVPIVVGAVLAGLIIIVLIAYLIGRRRSRQGYESV